MTIFDPISHLICWLSIEPILSTIFCIFINGYTLIVNILYLFYFSSSSKRPERLISKLKAMNLEDAARSGRKIVVLRQPKVSFGFFYQLFGDKK